MTTLMNLTQHKLDLVCDDGTIVEIPPSGQVARCSEVIVEAPELVVGGHMVAAGVKTMGDLQGLPAPQEGVLFFASALFAQAAWEAGRTDVVCGLEAVRDGDGRTIGMRGLSVAP